MKIKQSFVTNSSSSSFILVCQETTIDDLELGNEYYCYGDWLSDGRDIFILTDDMISEIKMNPYEYSDIEFMKNYSELPSNKIFSKDIIIPAGYQIVSEEKDYNPTQDLEGFIRRYRRDN